MVASSAAAVGGRCTHVGGEISNREIGFVAEAGSIIRISEPEIVRATTS